jgi:hypothetical protein
MTVTDTSLYCHTMPKAKPITWRRSMARTLLEKDLRHGVIPLDNEDMAEEVVYMQRDEFCLFPFDQICKRLRDMRKQARDLSSRATWESAALATDQLNHPAPTHDCRGVPRWEGSAAERLLKQDMDDDLCGTMKAKELYPTRCEYGEFPPTVFRKHVDQERQYRKFIAQLAAKQAAAQRR